VSQDTNARNQPGQAVTGASIRLRGDHFDLVTGMLGHTNETDRAAFINLSYRQLRRARLGNVGQHFVVQTLHALEPHRSLFVQKAVPITFEALFETASAERAA
jgi:hypothetical protein